MRPPVKFKALLNWGREPLAGCLAIAAFAAIAVTCLQNWGALQGLELYAYDQVLLLRPNALIDQRITVIGETEADIRRYGHPLPDQILADALLRLEQAEARVVGVDKYRDAGVPPGSEKLNSVLRQYENIVWIFFSGNLSGEYIAPPPALADKPEQTGFSDVLEDGDGVLRRGLLFLDVGGKSHYSFPLLIALHYLAKENIGAETGENGDLRLNGVGLPRIGGRFGAYARIDTGGYQVMLEYPGLPQAFKFYALSDLLDGLVPAEALKDKIVLLGGTAPSLQDYRLLPREFRQYGVQQHGYFVSQLLNTAIKQSPPLRALPDNVEAIYLFFWALAGSWVGLRRVGMYWVLLAIGIEFVALIALNVLLFNQGWWLPMIAPLFGWACSVGLSMLFFSSRERAERRQLMQLFASHVSAEVADRLWESREQFFREGGVRPDTLTATVLFTDLCNFTTVAENMEPLVLMKWLNQYMEEISGCIIEQGGVINKYIGDAVMAVFGVPIKSETEAAIAADAQRAVQCAMEFSERLRLLNQRWQSEGLPTITMRTGICTGSLVAGSLGGSLRREYTVIGDTVNTAARLESYDKSFAQPDLQQPCRILIGETTYQLVRHLYQARMVGECQLKGKNKFSKIYQILYPLV